LCPSRRWHGTSQRDEGERTTTTTKAEASITAVETTTARGASTMTTTERGAPSREGASMKLYLFSALALVYSLAWWAFAPRPASDAVDAPTVANVDAPDRVAWLQDLPAARRPAVALPAGWQLATTTAVPRPAAVSTVRRVATRSNRVRTRSS
jgi:hypothetical protein